MSRRPGSSKEVINNINPRAVRNARIGQELTLLEVASRVGVSKSTLSAIETKLGYGVGRPVFEGLAIALNTSPDSLLTRGQELVEPRTMVFSGLNIASSSDEDMVREMAYTQKYFKYLVRTVYERRR